MQLKDFEALASENEYGLVPMRVTVSFAPYGEGDIAGFPPEKALEIFRRKCGVPQDVDPEEFAAPEQSGDPTPEEVPIPEDWEAAHHLVKHKLAERLTGKAPANKDEAHAFIAAEVARRAEAAGGN